MFNTVFKSIPQALPNMFLTIVGTAKVTQSIKVLNALKDDFPNWKYFLGEFEQYAAGNRRVLSPLFLTLTIDFFDETHSRCKST
jgi:hypothetical protein